FAGQQFGLALTDQKYGPCIANLENLILSIYESTVQSSSAHLGTVVPMAWTAASFAKLLLACAGPISGGVVPELPFILAVVNVVSNIADFVIHDPNCVNVVERVFEKIHHITVSGSIDPNDKRGSEGVGPLAYISGLEPLRYSIFFTNEAGATAAAQTVVITDQLDPSKVDLTTFSFGPIFIGSSTQIMP